MTIRLFLLAGTMIGALSIDQASASVTYTAKNGTETFPGTYVGTVGNGVTNISQIGTDAASGNAAIGPTDNPSIYEFAWTGGVLSIKEELANNGTEPNGIDAALYALSSQSESTMPSSYLAQVSFPYTPGGGPDAFETVFSGYLAAGYYSLDTYAPSVIPDPYYQVNFSVPEPMSIALIGTGLLGLKLVRRRRSSV
jgi:hypothetical protein